MNVETITRILVDLDAEVGRASDSGDQEYTRIALQAHEAVGRLRIEGLDYKRMENFNNTVGAMGYISKEGFTPCSRHPDRCKCQKNDPIPHRHYQDAPHSCARCIECQSYEAVEPGT